MTKTFAQILKEVWEEKKEYFQNYRFYSQKIKKEAKQLLGGAVRVLVFGSVVEGKFTPQSDIDILIISDNLPQNLEERNQIRTRIKSAIDPFSPFQIHLVSQKEYQEWYQRFIKENIEEIE